MALAKPITPHLWFDTQAREAAEFYVSVFPDSRIDSSTVLHDTPSGDCEMLSFTLAGHPFMAISASTASDSGTPLPARKLRFGSFASAFQRWMRS